jgi:hypothetical protein
MQGIHAANAHIARHQGLASIALSDLDGRSNTQHVAQNFSANLVRRRWTHDQGAVATAFGLRESLDPRTLITEELVKVTAATMERRQPRATYDEAARILEQIVLAESFPELLTLPLYEVLQ